MLFENVSNEQCETVTCFHCQKPQKVAGVSAYYNQVQSVLQYTVIKCRKSVWRRRQLGTDIWEPYWDVVWWAMQMERSGLRNFTGRKVDSLNKLFFSSLITLQTFLFHDSNVLIISHYFFLSHTVNLLGNIPLPCLDVLLMPKVQQSSIEYMGVNMDAVNMLLNFMEKRLDQVRQHSVSGIITSITIIKSN